MSQITEERFRKCYGHSSLCNCVRRFKGAITITRRTCTCQRHDGSGNELKPHTHEIDQMAELFENYRYEG